jgi:dienelactone hydrolase
MNMHNLFVETALRYSLQHFRAMSIAFALTLLMLHECMSKEGEQSSFEVVHVPANDGSGRSLLVNVVRPFGNGPFPLAIVNHGSPALASKRPDMAIPTYSRISNLLLQRGFAVALPLRRGYGAVGGEWNESYGSCARPDFAKAGNETARDIRAVIDSLIQRDFIQKRNVFVIGQSAGGWGTLALASQNPKEVKGYIVFAGGRGGHRDNLPNQNCAPEALVRAASQYGKTADRPSLWIYSENDSYFGPELVKQMFNNFNSSGGKATLRILPPVGKDGHQVISNQQGFELWSPLVVEFLETTK